MKRLNTKELKKISELLYENLINNYDCIADLVEDAIEENPNEKELILKAQEIINDFSLDGAYEQAIRWVAKYQAKLLLLRTFALNSKDGAMEELFEDKG